MGIVLIAYSLLGIYATEMARSGETENAQLLLDRLYFQRKDAEWNFWKAAAVGPERLEVWERATERLGASSWVGEFLDAKVAFVEYRNESWGAKGLNAKDAGEFIEGGKTIVMHGSLRLREPAIETVILNPRPRAATAFVVRAGDYLERPS